MNPLTRFWKLRLGLPAVAPSFRARLAQPEGRSGAVLIAVGLFSSIGVYLGHGWYHAVLLPSLGIGAALGDAVGGFVIILAAYAAQRLASLALFADGHFGLLRLAERLRRANAELKQELSEADMRASIDRLTGCWNRRGLEEVIPGEIERLARHDTPVSMLILDIDHFKSINDRFGHNAGDRVLVEVANVLRASLRLPDSLTRWGGEEFVVLCPNTPLTTAVSLAERLRERIGTARVEPVGAFSASFGVAECLVGEEWQTWLSRADAALYRSKRSGRNQVRFAPETPRRAASGDPRSFRLVQLSWRETLECGQADIDGDHKTLFAIANDLLNASVSGAQAKDLAALVELLVREATEHFAREEAVLAAAGYAGLAEHAAVHRRLARTAAQLLDEFKAGAIETGPVLQFLAHDLIAGHLLGADRKFFSHFGALAQAAEADA